jgi:hypothetical protein
MAAPYAYVVEYRAADACFPRCHIDGRRTGRASSPREVGDGAYVAIGSIGTSSSPNAAWCFPVRRIRFTLPARGPSVIDMSLASPEPGGGHSARCSGADRWQRRVSRAHPLRRLLEDHGRSEPHDESRLLGREEEVLLMYGRPCQRGWRPSPSSFATKG